MSWIDNPVLIKRVTDAIANKRCPNCGEILVLFPCKNKLNREGMMMTCPTCETSDFWEISDPQAIRPNDSVRKRLPFLTRSLPSGDTRDPEIAGKNETFHNIKERMDLLTEQRAEAIEIAERAEAAAMAARASQAAQGGPMVKHAPAKIVKSEPRHISLED